VVLAKKNGHELWQTLRDIKPTLEALFMSGYEDEITNIVPTWEKTTPLIKKPFTIGELSKKLRSVLDNAQTPPRSKSAPATPRTPESASTPVHPSPDRPLWPAATRSGKRGDRSKKSIFASQSGLRFVRSRKRVMSGGSAWGKPTRYGSFSKTSGEIIRCRHSRECGNPQLSDNARFMDPRLRGGDACALCLPPLF
jgi:DNA-binding response OmpR family regulator